MTFSPLIISPKNKTLQYYNSQTPMFFLWISNNSFTKGFVNMSANWSSYLKNSIEISSLFISSQIKWYFVSILLVFLWKTWLHDNAMDDSLSQKKWFRSCCSGNNSVTIILIHTVWHAVVVASTYSSSTDDKVTMGCFFESQAIALDPKLNTYPDVLFLLSTLPTKSLWVYPINLHYESNVYKTP